MEPLRVTVYEVGARFATITGSGAARVWEVSEQGDPVLLEGTKVSACPGPPHQGHASSDWDCPLDRGRS